MWLQWHITVVMTAFVTSITVMSKTDYWFIQAMAERSREIEVHKDMLKAQIKASETERRTVRYTPSL